MCGRTEAASVIHLTPHLFEAVIQLHLAEKQTSLRPQSWDRNPEFPDSHACSSGGNKESRGNAGWPRGSEEY